MKFFLKKLAFPVAFCLLVFFAIQCGQPESRKVPTTGKEMVNTTKDSSSVADIKPDTVGNTSNKNEAFPKISQQKRTSEISTYLPASANQDNKLPVILFLDPHASGALPVELYKPLADEFGYILVGSNRSHNGQTISEAFSIFEKMKNTVLETLPANASRVYVAGFSGGSRVAAAVGGKYQDIQSVIACGAGIGNVQNQPQPTFDYFGIVGNEDFNMNEMISTDRMLKRAGFRNAMVIFDGGHAWPPADVMREAFWWLDLNAMKQKTLFTNQSTIANAVNWYKNELSQLISSKRFFGAGLVAERAIKALDGLTSTDFFDKELQQIRSKTDYQKQLAEVVGNMQKEMGMQNSYISAMTEKDTTWWKKEIRHLQDSTISKNDRLMNKRLLSYLGLIAYMFSDKAVNEQNIEAAEKFLEIYRLVEPTNPEHFFLEAKRRMLMNDPVNAVAYLKLATILGFSDRDRILQEPLFESLSGNQDFKGLFR